MNLHKNFSLGVLQDIGKMCGLVPQFINDEEAILVNAEGDMIAHFFGMLVVEVNGQELNNVALRSGQEIARFIEKNRKESESDKYQKNKYCLWKYKK
jgi:hypothetical protein